MGGITGVRCASDAYLTAPRNVSKARAEAGHRGGVIMGTWFWLNIPLMLVFFGCWAGIPLWRTLTRWKVELDAKHAELAAARAVPAPVLARPAPAAAAVHETGSPAYAGAGDPRGR